MGIPSMWKVFIGLGDSYTLRLCVFFFQPPLDLIPKEFSLHLFCYVDIIFKGNKLNNLSITNIFAIDVPNSLEIIANRSSSKTFLFLVRCNFFNFFLTVVISVFYDDAD